jgi:hypothetical protein
MAISRVLVELLYKEASMGAGSSPVRGKYISDALAAVTGPVVIMAGGLGRKKEKNPIMIDINSVKSKKNFISYPF